MEGFLQSALSMGVKGPLLGGAPHCGLNKSAPPGVRTGPLGVKTGVTGAPTDPGAGETRLGCCAFLLLLGWLFTGVELLVPFFPPDNQDIDVCFFCSTVL